MSNIKKILISSVISLAIILISTCILNLISNKDVIEIPIVVKEIEEGKSIIDNISFVEINLKELEKEVLENIATNNELIGYVANVKLAKGEIILKNKLIAKEEYLEKVENLEYVSLPIKNATEGVSYKLNVGEKINVYYTAKRKLVDNILKSKIKVYSSTKDETIVTCLLYQNVEVISLTNNMGVEVTDGSATNILVRLKKEEVIEFVNIKDQGVFTYSLI